MAVARPRYAGASLWSVRSSCSSLASITGRPSLADLPVFMTRWLPTPDATSMVAELADSRTADRRPRVNLDRTLTNSGPTPSRRSICRSTPSEPVGTDQATRSVGRTWWPWRRRSHRRGCWARSSPNAVRQGHRIAIDSAIPRSGYSSSVNRRCRCPSAPHVLHHSFVSLAADLGFNEPTIASLLGHKTHTPWRMPS